MPTNQEKPDPVHNVVLRQIYRFAFGYGGIPLGLACLVGLLGLMCWFFCLAWNGAWEWMAKINDPTERGLAYIASAIVFHAFFGKSNTDVKVDGKRP